MITSQEWADWKASPVTQKIIERFQVRSEELVNQLLGLSTQQNAETYGMQAMAIRYQLEGLGELLDLDDLKESIVDEDEGARA